MKVLITNNRLEFRGGAESFVRDLARNLQSFGHTVMAYSSDLGQRDRLLTYDQVPVTTDLANLPFKPDIIHAQHHLDAITAIAALPGVPAVYHIHGAVWRDRPPIHPAIKHYLAMSRTIRERAMIENNIPPSDITVFLNSVDLHRFQRIRNLPEKPLRALFYNPNHGPQSPVYQTIREAAETCGLTLDAIGYHFSNMINNPQEVLSTYDVVFASGLSAIDALASGCAVIVVGANGCGPLICRENYDRLRTVNFSIPINSPPPSVAGIIEEIRRYSQEDATAICQTLRHDADQQRSTRDLIRIYESVIQQYHDHPPSLEDQMLGLSNYLRTLVPLIKMVDDNQCQNGMPAYKAEAIDELSNHLLNIVNIIRHP
ncbi:glycosyltransferase family 4 protein [Phragmitibacter flavus]|uniref:Glycosyltransferase family 4 protein n=1 Tax=Phragmitibacter flavus TaxID=2576071 RepID=A0A5R8KFV9_9BACT|nr:glycosyltransferase [Phragmitibacter flavus]TLD71197.1 glycosyltransferase family 4 protein [Phragmitibacter flavus]